jgi:hypothetical protein
MTTLISRGSTSVTPITVMGYKTARASGNVVHEILGRTDPDVTLRAAALRTGTLEFLFASHADAQAAEAILAGVGVITLADSDLPDIGMRFVLSGTLEMELEQTSRTAWTVTADYTEVAS